MYCTAAVEDPNKHRLVVLRSSNGRNTHFLESELCSGLGKQNNNVSFFVIPNQLFITVNFSFNHLMVTLSIKL